MKCPDTDRLIDLASGGRPDGELESHLDACPDCREDLELIREIPAAFSPRLEVPEHLVQKTMALLRGLLAEEERRRALRMEVLGTAILGSLTAAAVILLTGSGVGGGTGSLLTYCMAIGVLSGAIRFGEGRRRDLGRV